ncbi:MAG: ABC transporter ATP-binding protein [Erysipelotrichaceae bacterium]|nr:ABC transporter ATP-binding protein [Erysipelotrichaceae bacterium]
MSVGIKINHAVKAYGDNVVIPDLSLEVNDGEFFTLLGPSGCGKTTLLRMIAGFNSIEGGDFYFGDKRINNIDPAKRNIGMVFQNYAIFPHLTVEKNVQFGLKNRKMSKEEMQALTDEFMKLMHIDEYKDRMPERLSGGQQQRVALARALVIKPDVLLMDEPLSNLDAKLRVEMRTVIKQIQREVGITNVYVTHDQEEAMSVSDRIAVMDQGEIQHIGKPKDIYQRPANLFVASFIGRTNLCNGKLNVKNGKCIISLADGYEFEMDNILEEEQHDQDVILAIRPEELVLNDKEGIHAKVNDSVFLGLNTHYYVLSDAVHCIHTEDKDDDRFELIQESLIDEIIPNGTAVRLKIKKEKVNIFTADGKKNIVKGVKNDKYLYGNK